MPFCFAVAVAVERGEIAQCVDIVYPIQRIWFLFLFTFNDATGAELKEKFLLTSQGKFMNIFL